MINKKIVGLIIGLVICALIPLLVKSPYYIDLLIMTMVNAALAMMFIMGLRAGLINMGIVSFWGMGAYASAILSTKLHMNVWLSMPTAALVTGVIAFIFGVVLLRKNNSGFGFVMLSVIIGMLFSVVVGSISYLGAWNGISNIPPPSPIKIPFLPPIEFISKIEFFYLGMFIFLIIVLISYAFYAAWTGRAWIAIGLGPRLAESIGINLFRYRLLAFVLSSTLCGLIGAFYAHYQAYVVPDTFGMWQNIYVQIYAILGGVSFAFLGPVVGAVVMTFFPEYIRMASVMAPVFTGILLILLILFLPGGLLGLGKYWPIFAEVVSKKFSLLVRKARQS